MHLRENRLVRRIAAGDPQAFAEFVDQFGPRIHRLARRYARTEADAEDLVQEIFIDLYHAVGSFRGRSTLSTWVYRIAMNHCLKHAGRLVPATVPLDDALDAATDPATDPERQAARSELGDRVHSALGRLAPIHADVVILHELHELTYGECAEILQIPVGTVKSRLSHAFCKLRAALSEYVLTREDPPVTGVAETTA